MEKRSYHAVLLLQYKHQTRTSDEAIAQALGVSQTTVSRWLRSVDPTQISVEFYRAIERLTGYKPTPGCPLEDHCPCFSGGVIDHIGAQIMTDLQELSPDRKRKVLAYIARIKNKA